MCDIGQTAQLFTSWALTPFERYDSALFSGIDYCCADRKMVSVVGKCKRIAIRQGNLICFTIIKCRTGQSLKLSA